MTLLHIQVKALANRFDAINAIALIQLLKEIVGTYLGEVDRCLAAEHYFKSKYGLEDSQAKNANNIAKHFIENARIVASVIEFIREVKREAINLHQAASWIKGMEVGGQVRR